MVIIDISHSQISFQKSTQCFCVELSDLPEPLRGKVTQHCISKAEIKVHNPKTNNTVSMFFTKADMDGSHEDIYGWNYKGVNPSNKRAFKFLFIND